MNKPKIVVITEDTGTQTELARILEETHYEQFIALNGVDGVAISQLTRPSAVIVDSNISGVEALGVCKALLANENLRSIPAIVLADAAESHGPLTTLANFGGIIQRPIQAEQVNKMIRTTLEAKPKAVAPDGQKPVRKRDEPIKVLSVDDSSVVRKLVTMILTAEGFKVSTASDGLDGINKAKEIKPDIILLDFVMPKMNGFQVCRILQKDEKLRQIPVILVTSKGDKVGDKFVNQLGVTDYITKPFQPEELVTKIHQTLEAEEPAALQPEASQTAPGIAPSSAERNATETVAGKTESAPASDSMKTLIHEEASRLFAQEFEPKIHEMISSELSKFMKNLDKRIEKAVVEKMNEYIRRAKKR